MILTVAWVIGLAVYGPLDAEFTIQHLAYRVLPQACAVWGLVTVVLCRASWCRWRCARACARACADGCAPGQVARSSLEIDRPIARASRLIWNS